jgi:hypothetical protein
VPLVFPGSDRKKGDEPVNPNELVFRDGKREVAPYLVDLMSNLDTVRYTYTEAIAKVNDRMSVDFINNAYNGIVRAHFREPGR